MSCKYVQQCGIQCTLYNITNKKVTICASMQQARTQGLQILLYKVLTLKLIEQSSRGIGPHELILLPF
jgi:hypothetical protein